MNRKKAEMCTDKPIRSADEPFLHIRDEWVEERIIAGGIGIRTIWNTVWCLRDCKQIGKRVEQNKGFC